jgi:hypothetical protein
MANISVFKSASAIPDFLREGDDLTKRIAGNASSGKSISIRGGVWRMVVDGEEVTRNEDRAMNFVIVNVAPNNARTFYAGKYVEGETVSPTCWSADGKLPAPDVKTPQGANCMTCPQNIAGSGENGTRACRFSRRLAVVLEGDMEGSVFRLQLPAKSLFGKPEGDKMALEAYAKQLASHNIPISGVVTEARFDTNEAVPVLRFRAVRPLNREEWEVVKQQRESEDAKKAVEVSFKEDTKTTTPALPAAVAKADFVPSMDESAELTAEPTAEPVKRTAKKPEPVAVTDKKIEDILGEWADDDE